jgi:hypothetical protein
MIVEMRPLAFVPVLIFCFLPQGGRAQAVNNLCRSVVAAETHTGGFEFGHIDNRVDAPIVDREFKGRVIGEHNQQSLDSALVQLRGKRTRGAVVKIRTGPSGDFRFPSLPPGPYFFVAVAEGFQSISGCVVIERKAHNGQPVILRLPLGV